MNQRKPTKTISGVAPLAVMLPPKKCPHGTCLYCPSYGTQNIKLPSASGSEAVWERSGLAGEADLIGAPQSYTPQSPAVLRAIECNYDPAKQVRVRLKQLQSMNHPTDKIELIIMGGTFLSYPEKFQLDFITKCYQALNSPSRPIPPHTHTPIPHDALQQAKTINEKAKHRVTALCIETRPDFCADKHIKDMLEWGTTRIELGVQAIDDDIYKKVNRGHKVQDVIDATKRLKQAGFKIGYHLMPGIPGSNPKKDIKMFKKIFKSKDFKPDQIKIYPCQVLKGAGIEDLYYGGEYIPYTKQQTTDIIIKMLKLTPRYCRIMRIMREIPLAYLVAGLKDIGIRKDIEESIRKSKTKVKEIRFREIGFALRDKRKINPKTKIKTTKYKASGGTEFFIEAINKDDILFGLTRLRLDKQATVRELHVYGPALRIKPTTYPLTPNSYVQHLGLGKQLLQKAEQTAKKKGYKKLRIISGVGVREYYKNLGYKLDKQKTYMEKNL